MSQLSLPTSRRLGPDDVPQLGWGILGTGWIAERFCTALRASTTQRIAAVASRSQQRAEEFGAAMGAERSHGSLDAMLADPAVDVVYVATPHPNHHAGALRVVAAGKHVLVEKPMALNAQQAREVAAAAQAAGVFCAEALWTLFLPKFDVVRQLVTSGDLGEILGVQADQGEWFDAGHRILDPELAGGAMLDLGTYPVMFATWLLGQPDEVRAVGARASSGVMGSVSMSLRYPSGAQAALQTSCLVELPNVGCISGTRGMVQFDRKFYQPGGFTYLDRASGTTLRYDEEAIEHAGLFHEALEVARCIGEGRTQTPLRPLGDTISYLDVMDEVRDQIGDRFVME